MNEDIVKDLVGDARAIAELEKEWEQLTEDRLALRQIFPSGESKVCVIMLAVSILFFFRTTLHLLVVKYFFNLGVLFSRASCIATSVK